MNEQRRIQHKFRIYLTTQTSFQHNPITYLEVKPKQVLEIPIFQKRPNSELSQGKFSRTPRIYGLPQIHKQECSLRPVVCAFNLLIHMLAQHLAHILQPAAECTSYIKNFKRFIDTLKTHTIREQDQSALTYSIFILHKNPGH